MQDTGPGLGRSDVDVVKADDAVPATIRGVHHADAGERRLDSSRHAGARGGRAVDQDVEGTRYSISDQRDRRPDTLR
jgi:hypothetical protein